LLESILWSSFRECPRLLCKKSGFQVLDYIWIMVMTSSSPPGRGRDCVLGLHHTAFSEDEWSNQSSAPAIVFVIAIPGLALLSLNSHRQVSSIGLDVSTIYSDTWGCVGNKIFRCRRHITAPSLALEILPVQTPPTFFLLEALQEQSIGPQLTPEI
jgi:hypothetical protein